MPVEIKDLSQVRTIEIARTVNGVEVRLLRAGMACDQPWKNLETYLISPDLTISKVVG